MSIHEMIELLLRYPNQERTVRRVQPFQNSIVIEIGEYISTIRGTKYMEQNKMDGHFK